MTDREKLIELLAVTSLEFEEAVHLADHLIANGVTAQKWIPVTERLPEESGVYLVFSKAGNYSNEYFFIGENYKSFLYFENGTITHWMPLPEEPKEEAT